VRITPDIATWNVHTAEVAHSADVIVRPGGARGAATLAADGATLDLVHAARDRPLRGRGPRWVAAVCAATTVLVAAGGDAEHWGRPGGSFPRVTSHPSVKQRVVKAGWPYGGQDERVVVDGNVITSRGPGTALAWALAIVEEVAGWEKRMEVEGPMVVARVL
jgi:protein DJ-1